MIRLSSFVYGDSGFDAMILLPSYVTMIKYAGLGVAMENAVLPVRNAADYITASNNDDGVGLVVEKFMLA